MTVERGIFREAWGRLEEQHRFDRDNPGRCALPLMARTIMFLSDKGLLEPLKKDMFRKDHSLRIGQRLVESTKIIGAAFLVDCTVIPAGLLDLVTSVPYRYAHHAMEIVREKGHTK